MDNRRKEIVFEASAKSKGKAYLLWLFLGWLGAHRFYAGETKTGAIQAVLTLSAIGFPIVVMWWLVDFFLVPGMVNDHNMEIIDALNHEEPRLANEEYREPVAVIDEEEPVLDGKRARMLEDLRATGYRKERRDPSFLYR